MGLKSKIHEKEIIGSIKDKIIMRIEKERNKVVNPNLERKSQLEMMEIK